MSRWPVFDECPRCGQPVLKTRQRSNRHVQGRPLILALPEASLPVKKRRDKGRSIREGTKGRIAVGTDGLARRLLVKEKRRNGEAVHFPHRCPT